MQQSRAGFGVSNYSGGTTFKKTGKIVKGENYIRILPALGSLAESGVWRKFYVTHWGYAGVSSRDQSKTVMRPFRCILDQDKRTGMVRQDCPACTFLKDLKARAKELEVKFQSEGKTEDEIKTAMGPINDQIKTYNAEAKWYVNVLLKNGDVSDFKLNHKDHMNGIMRLIKGPNDNDGLVEKEGIDPTHPDQGVWFLIYRGGDGVNPPDTVNVEMEDVTVGARTLKDIKRAPLDDEQAAKVLKNFKDLTTLGGVSLTYDQIKALVAAGGDPEEIDRIFGARPSREQSKGLNSEGPSTEGPPPKKSEPAPATVSSSFSINGRVVSKDQFERYTALVAQQQAKKEAEARKKAEEERLAAEVAKVDTEAARAADAALDVPGIAKPAAGADPMEWDDDKFLASFTGRTP